ncbi:MAG: molybdopterin molybdotransferase MoeA [Candidatus Eisenbacteria bacterium]|nr:molybdopterin molybdotransferase MoeA [Candidatus Eisenbacteria bacterium]
MLSAVRVLAPETVPLIEARGRALRRPFAAAHALPPFRNASMDGYAVVTQDLAGASAAAPVELGVGEVLPAGRVASRALRRGEAMRIMTGAMVPDGANAVVPFEDCERIEAGGRERARFARPARHDENIRPAGRDVREGDVPLPEGRELSAHDLALLAALGESRVGVGSRPRAAILSTGDELLEIDQALRPGAIRDSNRPMLAMLLEECGARVVASERVGDDARAFSARARRMLEDADVVLSIGGVSAGDFDPAKAGVADLGGVSLWRVAMKPGRPQAFGSPLGRLFFGLPGNPASVACTFEVLVRPALRKLQGFSQIERPRLRVRVADAISSRAGRTDFPRVTLEVRGDALWAHVAGEQVSGHLSPQSRAHALLVVPDERSALAAGDEAEALLLRWPESGNA